MPDDSEKKDVGPVPPKLDLKKIGILKQPPSKDQAKQEKDAGGAPRSSQPKGPGDKAPTPGQGTDEKKAPVPGQQQGVKPGDSGAKPSTLRIQISEPAAGSDKQSAEPEVSFKAPSVKSGQGPADVAATKAPSDKASAEADGKEPSDKKQTSRIPLESAKPAVSEGDKKPKQAPKTIRIKPAAPPSKGKGLPKSGLPAATAGPAKEEDAAAEKRKTSRISLEAALSAESEGEKPAGSTPKTIKLKRPSEAPTVKVSPGASPAGADKQADAKKALSKTARLDEEPAPDEDTSPTRRKTIKVKRPSAQTGPKGVSVTRPSEAPAAGPGGEAPAPEVIEKTSWVFPVTALVAVLVSCVVIYLLAAQAFGPKRESLQLSYGAEWLDLSWPGELPRS